MAKNDNLTDFLTDVADAIREKKGTTDKINPQEFSNEIKSIKTSIWTGHADVEGLKAIGWDDEDIAYYQEHGVNWMEEDDEFHKVSDDNKALYGVLTASNIQEYKDRIVWLPKIELNGNMGSKFKDFSLLRGVPILDMGKVTTLNQTFSNCPSLTCIYLKNTSKISNMGSSFRNCALLTHIHPFDTSTQGARDYICYGNISLKEGLSLNISGYFDVRFQYTSCYSMIKCGDIDAAGRDISTLFGSCSNLSYVNIYGLCSNLGIGGCSNFSQSSLLYMIEHEAATAAITITLHKAAYARLSTYPDIVAALAEHPLVSLASV